MNRKRFILILMLLLSLTTLVPSLWAQQATSGFYYYADGQAVSLSVSDHWVAVRLANNGRGAQTSALSGVRGLGNVAEIVELENPQVTLLPIAEGENAASVLGIVRQNAAINIEWALPVFEFSEGNYFVLADQFIASFPLTMTEAQIDAYNAQFSVERVSQLPASAGNVHVLRVTPTSGRNALDMANAYHTGGVAIYAEPNFINLQQHQYVPNDSFYPSQWFLNNTGQGGGTVGADIDAQLAWDVTLGSNTVIIAVIDDGIEMSHPDFSGKIVSPYDAVDNDLDPTPATPSERDEDSHGTNVAGLAAANTNNSIGVSGVCPSCLIMPIRMAKTLSNGIWYTTDAIIANAFYRAADNGADIINNSWGGGYSSTTINDAINYATTFGRGGLGSVVLFAAGNSYYAPVLYPANLPNVIAVGATNRCDQRKAPVYNACNGQEGWWGSSYGPEMDIAAPGERLYSADLLGIDGSASGDYNPNMNGTSGATPIAAGVAGLILSMNPNLTRTEVQLILEYSADDIVSGLNTGALWDSATGWGRVNANGAVRMTQWLLNAPISATNLPERPVLTWNDWLPAEYYYIEVRNAITNAVVAGEWVFWSPYCTPGVTCTFQISTALPAGTYKFRVSPYDTSEGRGSGVYSVFSSNFTIAQPTNLTPNTSVNPVFGNPTYAWTGLTGASHYYLLVMNAANQAIVDEVIDAAIYCTGLNCSVDPTTIRERNRLTANGVYRFWVRAWQQSGGTGAWSAMGQFTLNAAVPGQAVLRPPIGLNVSLRPTFDWDAPAGALWMRLLVTPAAGGAAVIDQWFSRTQACGTPTGTVCNLIQSPVTLMDGMSYNYQVQAYGPGGMGMLSAAQPFTVDVPLPFAPSGQVTGMSLTLLSNGLVRAQWDDNANTQWFYLLIQTTTGTTMHNQWYQRSGTLCPGSTCSITLTTHFPSGATYRIKMQAYGEGGLTPTLTQAPADLPINVGPPAAVTVFNSPLGTLNTTDRPTYQWGEVANATWYYLWSSGGISMWYNTANICASGVCTVPTTSGLGNGAYQWYVSTFGPGGMGLAPTFQNFSIGFAVPPAAPTGMGVTGTDTPYPTFSWTKDSNVTWYNIFISSTSTIVKNVWYHSSQICGGSLCSVQFLDAALANGGYNWYVLGYNPAGLGDWSLNTPFSVNVPVPAAPTLVAPLNDAIVLTNRPIFQWNTVTAGAWYNIEIKNSMNIVILTQWVQATTCTISLCTFQPTNAIPFGIHTWSVRAWNQAGMGSFGTANRLYALSMSTVPMLVQSDNGVLRNSGNWSAVQDANALGGSYAGNTPGTSAPMSLNFVDTSFDVIYLKGPSFGSFIIEVDGYAYQTVNSAAESIYAAAASVQGLAEGEHLLRIVPVNGSPVAIDAFYIPGGVVIGGGDPTPVPTAIPTEAPTEAPTEIPTAVPTEVPTEIPTEAPTEIPTEAPTEAPTEVPTEAPTEAPTETPTP